METVAAESRSSQFIDCREDEGQFRDSLRANNRKLFWENICSELIDNALEHSSGNCRITLEWRKSRGGELFRATDNGLGATDLQAFFKPGKSVQTGRSTGNSTFGMGLFVCECCLSSPQSPGRLRVATCSGGAEIIVGFRSVEKTMSAERLVVSATDENRREYGIGYSGTSITFSNCAKQRPSSQQLQVIANKLSRWYATSLASQELSITLIRDGVDVSLTAEPVPECEEIKSAVLIVDGHEFSVQWGVTKADCKDNGCRLIYGGKFFDTNELPCGDYRIGRFYAAIRIPRTIGKDSMDILKRNIEHKSLDELFDRCSELFAPELQQSDSICRQSEDESQSKTIASLLSCALKKPTNACDTDNKTDSGIEDLRDFKGRDMEHSGAVPRQSGRVRRGRRGRNRGDAIPDDFNIYWSHLGDDKGMVLYQHDGARVTFNLDVPMVSVLRTKQDNFVLSTIAAGHIAKDVEGSDKQKVFGFGDKDFSWIFREIMERMYAAGYST